MDAAEAAGVDIALRGERWRRHPDHRPAQALADEQRDHGRHGNRQRHHQLHAHAHGRGRPRLRRGACGGAGQGFRRGRPDRRRRRPRRCGQDRHPLLDRLQQPRRDGQVPAEGIRSIARDDIAYASEMGYAIKLLAIARRTDDGIDVRVHPTMIPTSTRSRASTASTTPSTSWETRWARRCSSARVLVRCLRPRRSSATHRGRASHSGRLHSARRLHVHRAPARPRHGRAVTEYYIRLHVADKSGVLAAVATVFGDHDVSIGSVIQKRPRGEWREIVYVTHVARENGHAHRARGNRGAGRRERVASVIRVEDL